jgi:predicted kinase
LARELRLPLFAKDDVKEILYENLGTGDRMWSQALGRAAFDLLFHALTEVLRAGQPVIVEGNFAAGISEDEFARVPPFRALRVFCSAPEPVLLDRFARRRRHPGHVDEVVVEEMRAGATFLRSSPLDIAGELIELDTAEAVDLVSLADRVRGLLAT